MAKLVITFALFQIAIAVFAIFDDDPVFGVSSLLGSRSTGETIDQALYVILIAVGGGILTDISRAVQKE